VDEDECKKAEAELVDAFAESWALLHMPELMAMWAVIRKIEEDGKRGRPH